MNFLWSRPQCIRRHIPVGAWEIDNFSPTTHILKAFSYTSPGDSPTKGYRSLQVYYHLLKMTKTRTNDYSLDEATV